MQLVGKLAQNLLWIIAAAFILAASAASAQTYPPDVDSVTAGAEDTTPEPGSSVDVTGTVTDADGNPVAGATVTFTLTSNPGGASFDNGQQSIVATTDENGVAVAVLNTGDEPGTIVVRVDSNGVVSQVTLTTGNPQALPLTGGETGGPATGLPLAPAAMVAGTAMFLLAAGAVAVFRLRTTGS